MKNKTVCIINRSEVVGRPLAAILSNDGAQVFSVDVNNILEFSPPLVLGKGSHTSKTSNKSLNEILSMSDVVISGVPTKSYKIDSNLLKPNSVAINFSHYNNFDDNVSSKTSIFIHSIGKVTVTILQRNLIKLFLSVSQSKSHNSK